MNNDFSQCYISPGLEFFKANALKSWQCDEYHDPKKPAIFVGIYHQEDIDVFNNHQSYKILFLGGSDYENAAKISDFSNTFCPVFSQSLNYQLSKHGVICKPWPVSVRDFSHIPTDIPLGDKIYVYSGNEQRDYLKDSSGLNKSLYHECIKPLISHFGEDQFIFAKELSMDELISQVYANAFIFIKPNELGGNSAMWELAHMGRKTISCGMYAAPNIIDTDLRYRKNSIKNLLGFRDKSKYPTLGVSGYKKLEHVINTIEQERKNIGTINNALIKQVQSLFSEIPWKHLDFWL